MDWRTVPRMRLPRKVPPSHPVFLVSSWTVGAAMYLVSCPPRPTTSDYWCAKWHPSPMLRQVAFLRVQHVLRCLPRIPTGQNQVSNRMASLAKVSTIVIKACTRYPPRMRLLQYLALRTTHHKGALHATGSCLDSGVTACVMCVPDRSLTVLRAQVHLGLAEPLRE